MIELRSMTDTQISNLIRNHEDMNARDRPLYSDLLVARARRGQIKSGLSFDKSLELLRQAATGQRCITYGDLDKASGLPWNLARHQMNGPNGHLHRLLDICHGWPADAPGDLRQQEWRRNRRTGTYSA